MDSAWSAEARVRITLDAAAARYGLTVRQLTAAARRRQLPVLRAGRQVWVRESDLTVYLLGAAPMNAALTPLESHWRE